MDAQTALNQILARNAANNPMTVQELRSLATSVEASVGNTTLLLYSGGVGNFDTATNRYEIGAKELTRAITNNSSVKDISHTQVGQLLADFTFQNALQAAAKVEGASFNSLYLGTDSSGNRINNISFWDEASDRLVNQHIGDYRLIMPVLSKEMIVVITSMYRIEPKI